MEERVDAVPAICPNDATILALRMLFDNISVLTEESAWFDNLDRFGKALSCCFDNTHGIWVRHCFVSDVVCLVKIAVESIVI